MRAKFGDDHGILLKYSSRSKDCSQGLATGRSWPPRDEAVGQG
jgi:hypothetical protein